MNGGGEKEMYNFNRYIFTDTYLSCLPLMEVYKWLRNLITVMSKYRHDLTHKVAN